MWQNTHEFCNIYYYAMLWYVPLEGNSASWFGPYLSAHVTELFRITRENDADISDNVFCIDNVTIIPAEAISDPQFPKRRLLDIVRRKILSRLQWPVCLKHIITLYR